MTKEYKPSDVQLDAILEINLRQPSGTGDVHMPKLIRMNTLNSLIRLGYINKIHDDYHVTQEGYRILYKWR